MTFFKNGKPSGMGWIFLQGGGFYVGTVDPETWEMSGWKNYKYLDFFEWNDAKVLIRKSQSLHLSGLENRNLWKICTRKTD